VEQHRSEVRTLVRTALLALVCAVLYAASRTIPVALRWLKYFCPVTTALAHGGFGHRLRHVFVSSVIIGLAFHPAEALSYLLLIGSFGLVFLWDGPTAWRSVNLVASLAVYVMSFTAWLHAAPWLLGFTFEEVVGGLLAPRYIALKPVLDAAGIGREEFVACALRAGLLTGAALGLTFYVMLHVSNALMLAILKRILRQDPPRDPSRVQS
jgi:hypothetical protein